MALQLRTVCLCFLHESQIMIPSNRFHTQPDYPGDETYSLRTPWADWNFCENHEPTSSADVCQVLGI